MTGLILTGPNECIQLLCDTDMFQEMTFGHSPLDQKLHKTDEKKWSSIVIQADITPLMNSCDLDKVSHIGLDVLLVSLRRCTLDWLGIPAGRGALSEQEQN